MVKAHRRIGLPVLTGISLALTGCAATSPLRTPAAATPLDQRYLTSADHYVTVEGVRYRVREEGPRDAPVVLMIHGFSFSLESWDQWAAGLMAEYRVVRFDLAGHGLSGPAPDNRYDRNSRVRRIVALMDRIGIGRAVIAGNSYGGLLAWQIAAAHPERVGALVLVDSAAWSINGVTDRPAPVPAAMRAYLLDPRPEMVRASAGMIFTNPAALSPARFDLMRDMIARPGNGAALLAHLEQFTLPAPDAQLARISAPTLILWGSADRVIPVEQAERLHRAIHGSRLIIYNDVGHIPQEEAPARSLSDLRAFLSEYQNNK